MFPDHTIKEKKRWNTELLSTRTEKFNQTGVFKQYSSFLPLSKRLFLLSWRKVESIRRNRSLRFRPSGFDLLLVHSSLLSVGWFYKGHISYDWSPYKSDLDSKDRLWERTEENEKPLKKGELLLQQSYLFLWYYELFSESFIKKFTWIFKTSDLIY